MRKIVNHDQVNNFLRYLILHGVSKKSIKFYKSDLINFLYWAKERKLNNNLVKEFVDSQTKTTPPSTINRRLSTLRAYSQFLDKNFMLGIENLSKAQDIKNNLNKILKSSPYRLIQENIIAKFDTRPKLQGLFHKIFFNRPNWYKTYHSYPVANYIHIAILVLFCTVSGYAFYDQIINTARQSLAYPATPVAPNKYLSFQGRLTNNLGNPITTARDITFKFYTASSGGTTLWDSTACSITPDSDGIFSTLLGSTCGGAINSSVFSENASVWVGVTVAGDAEATPRIQIATVAYALNSETLQGFPLGTAVSTVPYLNSSGELVIAAASPKIQSTSGTFAVEGVALTLTTPNTSNGIITINPDGTGTLDLTFEGTAAGGSANGFINATNANITSGALYGGTVASATTGYNFIDFKSGVSPTSKFSVNDAGNITTAGDIAIGGGNINPSAALTIGDNGDTLVLDSSDWDIDATGAITGVSFDANGTGNSISNIESADILDGTIAEADLKVVDTPNDEECFTYEVTTGDFEWQSCASASMTGFTAAGDSGGGQAITDGNTLSILGGINGIDTVDSVTDTITLNLDTTEIGTTTFGGGAGVTWTFDASAGTDTTIAFGDNTQTFTTGLATFSGDIAIGGGNINPSAALTIGDNGDTLVLDSSDWDINATGDMTGIGAITADGTISFTGTTIGLGTSNSITTFNIGTGTAGNIFNIATNNTTKDTVNIGSALDDVIINGAGTGSLINFANFDVGTSGDIVTVGDLNVNGDNITADGVLVVDGAGLTLQTTGAGTDITINAVDQVILTDFASCSALETVAGVLTCGSDAGGATAWDDIGDPDATADIAFAEYAQTMSWNTAASSAVFDGLTVQITNDAGTDGGTQQLFVLNNVDDAGSTGTTEALMVLVNNDANEAVTDGILFGAGGAGTDFTDGIDFSGANLTREIVLENGEAIIGQTADTITFEDDDGTDYATLTGTALTVAGDLAITGGNITSALTMDSTLTVTGTSTLNGLTTVNDDLTVALTGNENVEITDGATPTTDTLSIVANGATVTTDTNALEIDFTTGDGASVTNSGLQIDLVSGGTAAGDIINGINLTMDAADASTQTAINVGANFDTGIAFGDVSKEIVLENLEAIHGQTADTITFEDDDGTDYATLTGTALTVAGDLAITGGNITSAFTADSTVAVTGTLTANGTLDANGIVTLGDNGDTLVLDSSDWDIDATGAITGVSFDANGTGNSITNIESADIADGTIAEADLKVVDTPNDEECFTYEVTTGDFEWQSCGGSIVADSLDFTEFTDSMSLDADTSIAAGVGEEITYNKAFTDATSENGIVMNFTGLDTTSGTTAQYGLYLDNVASTEGVDSLITLNNADADDAVGSAILFTAGGAGTDFTYGINFDASDIGTAEIVLENAETIDNQTDGTIALSGILTVNGTSGNGIDITNTGITTDLVLQNDETIDNNTDGTITLTATNTSLSGNLKLGGKNILDSVGTSMLSFAVDPTAVDSYNTLTYGSWLIENPTTGNPGIAALMVNQQKGGDIFTASASGVPKFTITNTGVLTLANGETIDNSTNNQILLTATTTKTSANLDVAGTSGINLSGVGGDITFANAEKIDNDTDGTITLTAPTTSLSGILTVNGTSGNGIDITNTGITTDLVLQNDETIDNNTDGTITLTATTTALTGDETFTDDNWLGLGSAAARIEFDDQTVDEVNILDANVGIGTSAPTATLDIQADVSTPTNLAFQVGYSGSQLITNVANDSTFASTPTNWTGTGWASTGGVLQHTALNTADATLTSTYLTTGSIKNGQAYQITFTVGSRTNGTVTPKIGTASGYSVNANGTYTQTVIANADNASLIFSPDGVGAFTGNIDDITLTVLPINTVITDAGRLGIGRSNPSYYLDVLSPGTGVIARFARDNISCNIDGNSTLTCTSDERLKKNIENLGYGLDTVMNLRPVEFDWKDGDTEFKNLGFIAQEVETIIPNIVSTDIATGYKSLNQIGIIPILTRAIQDLATRFETKEVKTNLISPITNSDLVIDLQPDNSQEASKLVIKGENDTEVASIDATGKLTVDSLEVANDATIAGTLYADNIESSKLAEIENLLREVESNQNILAQSASWEVNTATDSGNLIANTIQAKDLFVTGQTAMTSLFVSDNLATKSINSLDSVLGIQSLAAMPVEIMAGKIKIDTSGNVYFSGNIEVAGDLTVNNLVVANSDPIATESGQINSGEITTNAIAGKAVLLAGQTEIKINNPKLKTEGLIYVTPVSSTQNKVLYVKSKDVGTFTVGFNEAIDTEVEFNWWIIDLKSDNI